MDGPRVAVYGLSTEGYAIASHLAVRGADVSIIDESTQSAISLKAEIAKTYPSVSVLKEDEPLLAVEPIDVAISKSEYLFFTPRIRKMGHDAKSEIHSKFKDAVSPLKRDSSVVFAFPTGFEGNIANTSLLEHVTGFKVGKHVSYFYYPLEGPEYSPGAIGSFRGRDDPRLFDLLALGKKRIRPVTVTQAEHFHAIDILSRFSGLCSLLEVCRYAYDEISKADPTMYEFRDTYLDNMVNGLSDLRLLGSSLERANTMTYLINGSIKCIDGYSKRLVDEIRRILRKRDLKASRTRVALSWTIDQHAMRGDKISTMNSLVSKLRDYIGNVGIYDNPDDEMLHNDKTIIILACSKADYEGIREAMDPRFILMKANPLYEIVRSDTVVS